LNLCGASKSIGPLTYIQVAKTSRRDSMAEEKKKVEAEEAAKRLAQVMKRPKPKGS